MIYKEKLETIREEKGISQYSLSEYLNLNKKVYGQYEREYVIMPIKHLVKICNYLDVSLDYVMSLSCLTKYENMNLEIDSKLSGTRLKKLRKELDLTQAKLAETLKVAPSLIGAFEKGRRKISTPFLYTICKKYNVSADYLLGRIDSPKYLK